MTEKEKVLKDVLKKTSRVNKYYKKAYKAGINDSVWYSEKQKKFEELTGKKAVTRNRELINDRGLSRISLKRLKTLQRNLNSFLKSPMKTKTGQKKIQAKRKKTFMERYGYTEKEARSFYKLITSKEVTNLMDDLGYLDYSIQVLASQIELNEKGLMEVLTEASEKNFTDEKQAKLWITNRMRDYGDS